MKSLSETKSTTESLLGRQCPLHLLTAQSVVCVDFSAKDNQKSSTDHGTTAESDYAAQVEKLHFQVIQVDTLVTC